MKAWRYNLRPAMFIYAAAESMLDAQRVLTKPRDNWETYVNEKRWDGSLLSPAPEFDCIARMGKERVMGVTESGGVGISGESDFRIAVIADMVFWANHKTDEPCS